MNRSLCRRLRLDDRAGPPALPAVVYRCRAQASRDFLNDKTEPDYDGGDRKEL